MANFHRKTLIRDAKPQFFVRVCLPPDGCVDLPPPPPPPPPPSQNHPLSPLIILAFCSIGVAFSFICYLTIIKTCRACRNRSRRRSHGNTDETHEDFIDEDHGTVVYHPIWLINTIGLDQSVIDSIEVFKYRKGDGLIEGTDCAVCLGEFQDEESLRLLPKCSHAFHVPCIDTWLRSHKHCPLCRAPIVNDTTNARLDPNSIESNTQEEIPNGDSQNETNEVENPQEIFLTNADNSEKKSMFVNATSSGVRVQSDLTDHRREELQPMRRSVSMDSFSASMVHIAVASIDLLGQEKRSGGRHSKKPNVLQKSTKGRASSSGVSIYSRVMKSSSFGRCSLKASSSHNRSY